MEIRQDAKQIDFIKMGKSMLKHKKSFLISLPTAFIIACFYVLCIPRWYNTTVELAPETSSSSLGSLGALASTFNMNLANKMGQNTDAILPELYPNLMESMDFRVSLFSVKVKTQDGKTESTYYEYLKEHQKYAWWENIIKSIKAHFMDKDKGNHDGNKIDPFHLTKEQFNITYLIGSKIKCSVDKKTNVISISVSDQDPLISATMADSVKNKLQTFITDYRTSKARNDLHYTKRLYTEAKNSYERARQAYGSYGDANTDVILESYKLKSEDMENDMQLKYNAYSALTAQLQTAKAKVQESTPAFTTLQSATVPIKPAGPKRMIIVLVIVFLTFIVNGFYAVIKD